MILETLSGTLTKAVPIYAHGFEFNPVDTKEEEPSGEGIHRLIGTRANRSEVAQLLVLPYCLGCQGSTFWMRVSGWWNLGQDANTQIWIRTVLSTTVSVAGQHRGFKGRLLTEEERLATNSVYVPTFGAKLIEFEFLCDLNFRVEMNALWAIA